MKKLFVKTQSPSFSLDQLQKQALPKKFQQKFKGGDDDIIIQDVVEG